MNLKKGLTRIVTKDKKIFVYTEKSEFNTDKILKRWSHFLPSYTVIFINIKTLNNEPI